VVELCLLLAAQHAAAEVGELGEGAVGDGGGVA